MSANNTTHISRDELRKERIKITPVVDVPHFGLELRVQRIHRKVAVLRQESPCSLFHPPQCIVTDHHIREQPQPVCTLEHLSLQAIRLCIPKTLSNTFPNQSPRSLLEIKTIRIVGPNVFCQLSNNYEIFTLPQNWRRNSS